MIKQKLLHSKCQNCGKYGIPLNKTGGFTNPIVSCSYCHNKFHVNNLLSGVLKVTYAVFIGIVFAFSLRRLNIFLSEAKMTIICIIIIVIGIYLLDRFAPLTNIKDE